MSSTLGASCSSHWSATWAGVIPRRAATWATTGLVRTGFCWPRGDQALVAGRHHHGQLVIKARADAPVAGQAEVDRCQLAEPQAAEVVLDAVAQLVRVVEWKDGTAVVSPDRDLANDRQPVRIGIERLADQ